MTETAAGGPPAHPAGSAAPSASPYRAVAVVPVASSSLPTWKVHHATVGNSNGKIVRRTVKCRISVDYCQEYFVLESLN